MSLSAESPATLRGVSSALQDSGSRCCECGYNLTGVIGSACPECGWRIDWDRAADKETLRPGSPAQHAQGWRRMDQTVLTVGVMLVLLWRFAGRLRADEQLGPGLSVAVLSFVCLALPDVGRRNVFVELLPYVFGVGAVIVSQSLVFASLYRRRTDRDPRWPARFRMWILVSLYSTCFVAAWRIAGPPFVSGLTETNFYWPFDDSGILSVRKVGVTIIYYWWWVILATVLLVRNRPRRLAALGIPLVFGFSYLGALVTAQAFRFLEYVT